jgi:hypothetical protein
MSMTCVGYDQIDEAGESFDDTAYTLTAPSGANVQEAWVSCSTQDVRYRLDGTAPDTSTGAIMSTTHPPIRIDAASFNNAKFIADTAGAVLHVHFFGTTG